MMIGMKLEETRDNRKRRETDEGVLIGRERRGIMSETQMGLEAF